MKIEMLLTRHNLGGGILLAFSAMEGRSGRYRHMKLASS
jgi:hypothetical protein